jgi:hypothetical protein
MGAGRGSLAKFGGRRAGCCLGKWFDEWIGMQRFWISSFFDCCIVADSEGDAVLCLAVGLLGCCRKVDGIFTPGCAIAWDHRRTNRNHFCALTTLSGIVAG